MAARSSRNCHRAAVDAAGWGTHRAQRMIHIGAMRILVSALGALLLVGCAHRPADGEAVEDACAADNDGQKVTVSGYITMSKVLTLCSANGCPFYLQQPRGKVNDGEQSVRVSFPEGKGARELEPLGKSYTDKDVVFRDDDEKTFGIGDAVRITGKINVSEGSCAIYKPTAIQAL